MPTEDLSLPKLSDIPIEQTDHDLEALKKYIPQIKRPNCYVEIGTKHGGSALWANINNKDIDIYAIDPLAILEYYNEREDVGNIHFIKKTSLIAARDWDKPIGVLFIDGNHNQAQQDFGAWEKYVVPGGYILFHDYAPHSPKVKEDCDFTFPYMNNYKILYIPSEDAGSGIYQVQKLS